MERFVIIVNGWMPLTIITKCSILGVAAALDPPLLYFSDYFCNIRRSRCRNSQPCSEEQLTWKILEKISGVFLSQYLKSFSRHLSVQSVNNRDTGKMCEISSKLTINTPEQYQLRRLVSLLLTLKVFHNFSKLDTGSFLGISENFENS